MNETITKEQVLQAYNAAPGHVREKFNDEKTTQLIVDLQSRLGRNDGILGKETGYLLLGLTDPKTFASNLSSEGFSDSAIREINKELNDKIFLSLQQKEDPARDPSPSSDERPKSIPWELHSLTGTKVAKIIKDEAEKSDYKEFLENFKKAVAETNTF